MRTRSSLDRVAVVITHYKAPRDLERCLSALSGEPGRALSRVVVADCDAQPGHGDLVRRTLPGARYMAFAKNVGYAALVNAGITSTDSEYVLVLNADVVVRVGAIAELIAHLDENPDVAVVAPSLLNDDGSPQVSAFGFYRPPTVLYRRTLLGRLPQGRRDLERFEAREVTRAANEDGAAVDVDWVMGAAMMVRRAAIDSVGLLDEEYWMYFEDVDWCRRFWLDGWSVQYAPSIEAQHSHGRASKRHGALDALVNPMARRHLASARLFFRKHGTDHRRPVGRPRVPSAEAA